MAESTDDVVAAVNFARQNNLRLVVKGGGDSYQGTSNAADSLLIWTRKMNAVTLHDAFEFESLLLDHLKNGNVMRFACINDGMSNSQWGDLSASKLVDELLGWRRRECAKCSGGRFKENGAIFTHHHIKKSQERPHGLEIGKVAARDKKRPHVCRAELAQSSQGRCIDDCVCCDGAVEVSG